MNIIEICLLKEGDKVYVNNKKKTVTQSASNGTIHIEGKPRYFSEISKNKVKESGYAHGIYAKLNLD